jgi:phosphoadenosine phosphosulfate reductase
MLLTSHGKIVEDHFVRISEDGPIPDSIPVLAPATRFLADHELACRQAPTGVLWPNDRKVAELVPHLDRLALIALSFPKFRDGRAYSQARQLREHYHYQGELRATGDVLRDQFLFMLRAGFDSFELRKESDVKAFAQAMATYSVFYQPTGDGRVPVARARHTQAATLQGDKSAGFNVSSLNVEALNRALAEASPHEILNAALQSVPRGEIAVVSSFGIESAALLKVVADVDASLPVIFLNTGWLFDETLEYRDAVVDHLGLSDVRTIKPSPMALAKTDPSNDLWSSAPDACCGLRKVAPLDQALVPFSAWITGRKRYQGGERASLNIVEIDGQRLKFNPFARISPKEVAAIFRLANLPYHPLAAAGFTSIGCIPCSTRALAGEGVRAGRWRGTERTECGIHGMSQIPAASPNA